MKWSRRELGEESGEGSRKARQRPAEKRQRRLHAKGAIDKSALNLKVSEPEDEPFKATMQVDPRVSFPGAILWA